MQLTDVIGSLYGDAEPVRQARKPSVIVWWLITTLAEIFIEGNPTASCCTLRMLTDVQIGVLWREAVVVLYLVRPVTEVEVMFRPRAVTGAVGWAVGH